MLIRFMHSILGRSLHVAVGGFLVIDAIARHFTIAVPMVLFGSVLAVNGVAGVYLVEEAYNAALRHGFVTPPRERRGHA